MEILIYPIIATIILGFLLGGLILFKPFFKSIANNYLAYAILTISFLMLNMVLWAGGFYQEYDLLTVLYDIEWVLLLPVFLFNFVLRRLGHNLAGRKELKLFYIPFIFSLVLNVVNCMERDYEWIEFKGEVALKIRNTLFMLENFSVYLFIYFIVGWQFFILKDDRTQKDLKWLWRLWLIITILIVTWTSFNFIENNVSEDLVEIFTPALLIGLSFFLYWISYNTIYKHKLSTEIEEITALLDKQAASTPLVEAQASENSHFRRFVKLFEEDYIFRDPGITRELIAERLGISPGYLSHLISLHLDSNFSSYINQYRVEEVKQMLLDPRFDRYSIEAIGLEAGFSSKTTFYKAFKNFTGKTPKAYKNR